MNTPPLYPVIMAGGVGARFWPLSRRARPKQLLPLAGDPSTPLIAATAQRIAPLAPLAHTLVVTSAALAAPTRAALPDLPAENLLLEPVGRNTAPCVAWASAWVARRDPAAIVAILAADAFIADAPAFLDALSLAARVAASGAVVTLGITPTRPETGYGYLHLGEPLPDAPTARRVRAFVEKPDATRAAQYLASGDYLWNAGIFVFRADTMARAIETHLPALTAATLAFDAAAREHREQAEVDARYPTLPNISMDYGVMEKLSDVVVVPADCGWSDVGSWQAAWELAPRDVAGNAVRADPARAAVIDARGNMIVAPPGKTVAVIGVDDLVIVDTPDALLVVPRSRAQDVKRAVDELAGRGQTDVL
jgi:mannose-1-phosphate guanylyltransferase